MKNYISTPQGLTTLIGVGILAASTNANVLQTGGWLSSHALLVASLSAGVFAGARVVGMGAGKIGLVIVAALLAGEAYNLSATAERIVVARENGAAPLKAAAARRAAAIEQLRQTETGRAGSPRLLLASERKKTADKAYQKELREGGRCLTICKGLKDVADKAALEVTAAAQEAQQLHAKAIEAAKVEVAANPLPASATPFADRIGWAPWALDLFIAGLLSLGANGLAAALIGYGAHRPAMFISSPSNEAQKIDMHPVDVSGQSDFPDVPEQSFADLKAALTEQRPDGRHSANILSFVRPDDRPPNGPKPGKRGSARKSDVLANIRGRIDSGEQFASQEKLRSELMKTFGYIGRSTLSDWLKEAQSDVERTRVGRRKVIGG